MLELGTDRCLLIAEVAQAHDGSLGTAHAYIDAAARAGADAVKFQTHIADAESTPGEPWRVRFSLQDESRYEYWRRMEFTEEQWHGLRRHARDKGLLFLSSAFSIEAVELLLRVGVDAWKIPSGETTNPLLFDAIVDTGLPVLVSTGMSDMDEIGRAVERVNRAGAPLAVLQCASMYPCPPEKVGLNVMAEFRKRFGCFVGLSDHSGTIYPGIAAVALGASVVEVHVTFSRESFGPDVGSSLTTEELKQLVEGIRFVERAMGTKIDKDAVAADLAGMRDLFTKSILARIDLPAGTTLRREHLTAKKPGTGIPVEKMPAVLGRVLCRDLRSGEFLQTDDLGESLSGV